jgi:hypothetical protein
LYTIEYGGVIVQDAILMAYAFNFIGAQANINVWNPKVEKPEDFTTAQMWLKATNGDNFESVEAGWTVSDLLQCLVSYLILSYILPQNSNYR